MLQKKIFIDCDEINLEKLKEKHKINMGIYNARDVLFFIDRENKVYGLSILVIVAFDSIRAIYTVFEARACEFIDFNNIRTIKDIKYKNTNDLNMFHANFDTGRLCEVVEGVLLANTQRNDIISFIYNIRIC